MQQSLHLDRIRIFLLAGGIHACSLVGVASSELWATVMNPETPTIGYILYYNAISFVVPRKLCGSTPGPNNQEVKLAVFIV
jgi:hypothetical protein